jgi:type III pantothenate kinase
VSGFPIVAVDIGNSRLKFGVFDTPTADGLPQPLRTQSLSPDDDLGAVLHQWLGHEMTQVAAWWIGSVNRDYALRLVTVLRDRGVERLHLMSSADLPLAVAVPRPDMVGIDRLLDVVGANCLRPAGRGAVVIGLGSAVKVDLVSSAGEFLGGAIMPGLETSARAMHEFTDLLPLVDMPKLGSEPPALGTNTIEAIRSGLFWGTVGGVRELLERYRSIAAPDPMVFLTGGAAPSVTKLFGDEARYEPNLTLGGIAASVARPRE